jgi:hypothetical protein
MMMTPAGGGDKSCTKPTTLMTTNEAASDLRQVRGILDARLLGAAVRRRNNARLWAVCLRADGIDDRELLPTQVAIR